MNEDDIHLGPYQAVVERVAGLVRHATPDQLDAVVPACPGWSAREVVSHLAGLAQDWVSGNLDGYASDAWAQAQVDRFADASTAELLAAWQDAASQFGDLGPSPLGATPARWAFGDAVTHEADLRPVLAPGTRVPHQAVALGLQASIGRWRAELAKADVPPLDVVASDLRTWQVGDPQARTDRPAETVTATAHDLFRAFYGRRSRSQMQAWAWSGDASPYLDVGLPYPFTRPDNDIDD